MNFYESVKGLRISSSMFTVTGISGGVREAETDGGRSERPGRTCSRVPRSFHRNSSTRSGKETRQIAGFRRSVSGKCIFHRFLDANAPPTTR